MSDGNGTPAAIERSPPHDLEAEVSVLGAMLLDNSVAPAIFPILQPESFYRESHGILYRAMVADLEDGRGVDAVLLRARLEREGNLEKVGGAGIFPEILDRVPTAAHAVHYAKIVAELSARRRGERFAHRLEELFRDGTAPSDKVIAQALAALQSFAKESSAPDAVRRFRQGRDILTDPAAKTEWICEWLIARRLITLFSGKAKGGKSTFLAALLGCVLRGEPFCGFSVQRSGVVYVSEEDGSTLKEKIQRFGCEDVWYLTRGELYPRPAFRDLLRQAATMAQSVGACVIVLDTFAALAGLGKDAEKDAGVMEEIADALKEIAREGFAIVVVHHLKKDAESTEGDAARGSSALGAAVDIISELRRMKETPGTPMRELSIRSRFEGSPGGEEPVVVEMHARGYTVAGNPQEAALRVLADRIEKFVHLHEADGPVRREDIADLVQGKTEGLGMALDLLTRDGRLVRSGIGKKGNPYRYGVPAGASRPGLPGPVATPTLETPAEIAPPGAPEAPSPALFPEPPEPREDGPALPPEVPPEPPEECEEEAIRANLAEPEEEAPGIVFHEEPQPEPVAEDPLAGVLAEGPAMPAEAAPGLVPGPEGGREPDPLDDLLGPA